MKCVLIPDSFKGTMSSSQICRIMSGAIRKWYPDADIVSIPVADGGEGSVDAFLQALGGRCVTRTVQGPFGEPVEGFYGLLPGGEAVIEMAACAGLPLAEGQLDPLTASTYGVGQLMCDALDNGCQKIILGLGGSATNDGGTGAAAACGVRFQTRDGESFVPTGGTLEDIDSIDMSGFDPRFASVEVTAMCDIDNPLCGVTGAAHIFGPQKGATPEIVERLDRGLAHLADAAERCLGKEFRHLPGAGAAGGMGGGMVSFWNAKLQMGIETVLDTVSFDELAGDASLVITGEGRLDGQSLRGKVVIGVAKRCQMLDVPVVAVVGDIADDAAGAYELGVNAIFSINRVAADFAKIRSRAPADLELTVDNLMRFCVRMGLFV